MPLSTSVMAPVDDGLSNKIANLAEQEDHHPKISLEWGKVSVLWWSHKIKGLHRNDFICASKTDDLYKEN